MVSFKNKGWFCEVGGVVARVLGLDAWGLTANHRAAPGWDVEALDVINAPISQSAVQYLTRVSKSPAGRFKLLGFNALGGGSQKLGQFVA